MAVKNEYILVAKAQGAGEVKRKFDGIGKSVGGLTTKVLGLAGAYYAGKGLINAFKTATRIAGDFEEGLKEIQTLTGGSTKEFNAMSKSLQSLAVQGGQSLAKLSKAQYDIVSAGFQASDATKVLEASMRLAVGGVSDVATGADVLTSALNAYGLEASDVTDVSDSLFTTVNLGKTTIAELGASLGQVAPIASTAGISLDALNASIATITLSGLSTAETATMLKQAFLALSAPTDSARKAMDEAGISVKTFEDGSTDLISTIKQFEGMDLEVLKKFIPNITALQAIDILAKDIDGLGITLDKFADKADASKSAFDTMSDTWNMRMRSLKANFDNIFIAIGEALIDEIEPLLDDINKELANLGDIGWDNITRTFLSNTSVMLESASIVAGLGGKAIALSIADGIRTIADNFRNTVNIFDIFGISKGVQDLMQKQGFEPDVEPVAQNTEQIKSLFTQMGVIISETYAKLKEQARELQEDNQEIGESFEVVSNDLGESFVTQADLIDETTSTVFSTFQEKFGAFKQMFKDGWDATFKDSKATANDFLNSFTQTISIMGSTYEKQHQQRLKSVDKLNKKEKDSLKLRFEEDKAKAMLIQNEGLRNAKLASLQVKYEQDVQNADKATADKKKALEKSMMNKRIFIALADTALAVTKTMASIPYPANIPLALAQAFAGNEQVKIIRQNANMMAEGADFITRGATNLTVGEAGAERVTVTPLERRGLDFEGGQEVNIVVNVSGNVLTQDFTEDELIPMINDAVSRGAELTSSGTLGSA